MVTEPFPRASRYAAEPWTKALPMGPNAMWLMESLCSAVYLEAGMRVMDLGCGRAVSSIFLAREFGVEVWATDLWIPPTENWERARVPGCRRLSQETSFSQPLSSAAAAMLPTTAPANLTKSSMAKSRFAKSAMRRARPSSTPYR